MKSAIQRSFQACLVLEALEPRLVLDNSTFVNNLYHDLLNRKPDPSGDALWVSQLNSGSYSKFEYNPAALALPTGLTFGDAGRNYLRNPGRVNFDMALFKRFAIKESMAFEFRAEAFNVFNHPQWSGFSGSMSCTGGSNNSAGDPSCVLSSNQGGAGANLFEMSSAHLGRILQLGAKFIF